MAPKFNYNNNFSFSKALELPQKAGPLESILAYKEMGWPNDTYVDGKNIPQWETYIRDYMANPSQYPNGYVFDEDGNLFLMRENDMFADMMDNYGFMQNHSFQFREEVQERIIVSVWDTPMKTESLLLIKTGMSVPISQVS